MGGSMAAAGASLPDAQQLCYEPCEAVQQHASWNWTACPQPPAIARYSTTTQPLTLPLQMQSSGHALQFFKTQVAHTCVG